jgi:acylphosphatase
MTAMRLTITGTVQGVFFRARTKEMADHLGLKGWVRNEVDGSVTIHAEGPTEKIEKLVEWCRTGPPAAQVDVVKRKDVEDEHCASFEVRRD